MYVIGSFIHYFSWHV